MSKFKEYIDGRDNSNFLSEAAVSSDDYNYQNKTWGVFKSKDRENQEILSKKIVKLCNRLIQMYNFPFDFTSTNTAEMSPEQAALFHVAQSVLVPNGNNIIPTSDLQILFKKINNGNPVTEAVLPEASDIDFLSPLDGPNAGAANVPTKVVPNRKKTTTRKQPSNTQLNSQNQPSNQSNNQPSGQPQTNQSNVPVAKTIKTNKLAAFYNFVKDLGAKVSPIGTIRIADDLLKNISSYDNYRQANKSIDREGKMNNKQFSNTVGYLKNNLGQNASQFLKKMIANWSNNSPKVKTPEDQEIYDKLSNFSNLL